MRFALVATAAAAAVAVPLAVSVSGPHMSHEEFLAAVRCTAYQTVSMTAADVAESKWQLNAEARRQPAETMALAQAEVSEIAREAATADTATFVQRSAAACGAALLAAVADSSQGA